MDTVEQVEAYAHADFSVPHGAFVERLRATCPLPDTGAALDVGCGAADITVRFARAFPSWEVDGLDGGPTMLRYGETAVTQAGVQNRVKLLLGHVPEAKVPRRYDLIVCNSLLHHLQDPVGFWRFARDVSGEKGHIFLMDLRRPGDREEAVQFVELYSSDTPDILKRDFFNSLLASYRADEVRAQLQHVGLGHLTVLDVGDHHLCVHGPIRAQPAP